MNRTIIYTSTLPQEAHFAQGFLMSHGVECWLKDELTVQVDNFISSAIGGVKLQVSEDHAPQAYKLLQEGGFIKNHENSKIPPPEIIIVSDKTEMEHCPYCKSDNISRKRILTWPSILLYIFISLFVPIFKHNTHCFNCDKEWRFKLKKTNIKH